MKKKIMFFCGDISRSGGTERVTSVIANGLASRGYEVIIVSLCGKGKSYYALDNQIRVIWLESKGLQSNIIRNLKKLKRIMADETPGYLVDVDIILCFYSLLIKRKSKETKWISWEHFNYFTKFDYNTGLRKTARFLVSRFSDCLLVLSEEDKEAYRQNMKLKCRIERMYNPTPYENIPEKTSENKVVLAVGRLTGIKGYDMLLDSWSRIEKDCPEWRLLFAGDGEERENLRKQAAKLGLNNVEFVGRVENICDYYQKASFFVLSSRNEGFAMVLLEAMAYSLPVVAFACKAGVKEMVEDGKTGYLADERNTAMLAEKMKLMMDSDELRHIMGHNAHEKMHNFSQKVILDQWEELLKSF